MTESARGVPIDDNGHGGQSCCRHVPRRSDLFCRQSDDL